MPITAALTVSLSGPYERQGIDAAQGVRLWAARSGVALTVADDGGSPEAAMRAYAGWAGTVDLLLGPYASGLVRAVAPVARDAGQLLWNHGGSADDLAQPGVIAVPAPASSYFHGCVDEIAARGIDRIVVIQGPGRFARAVAGGAIARARWRGVDARAIDLATAEVTGLAAAALLAAGDFEHDLAVIRRLGNRGSAVALRGAVAAGITAFGRELGDTAEGVLGPVQWWPHDHRPEFGPSGADFAADYRDRTGQQPSYPAAQAAAAGHLARAALDHGMAADDLPGWATSTLLGDFALDADWRQVGHRVTTVRWAGGRMVPLSTTSSSGTPQGPASQDEG